MTEEKAIHTLQEEQVSSPKSLGILHIGVEFIKSNSLSAKEREQEVKRIIEMAHRMDELESERAAAREKRRIAREKKRKVEREIDSDISNLFIF